MRLNELERDALIEIFNIGMGRAASSLNELLRDEIHLETPALDILPLADAISRLSRDGIQRTTIVRQAFGGAFQGQAMLLFPDGSSMELVRLISNQFTSLGAMTELEQETLTEVGNIMINACLASVADLFGESIYSEIPIFAQGLVSDLMSQGAVVDLMSNEAVDDRVVMLLQLAFRLDSHDLRGFMLFMTNIGSWQVFKELVNDRLFAVSGF